jgi:hypothetical protein
MPCLDLTQEVIQLSEDSTRGGLTLLTAYSDFSDGAVTHIIPGRSSNPVPELPRGAVRQEQGILQRYLTQEGTYKTNSHVFNCQSVFDREIEFQLLWHDSELLGEEDLTLTIEFGAYVVGLKLVYLGSLLTLEPFHRFDVHVRRGERADLRTLPGRVFTNQFHDYSDRVSVYDAMEQGPLDDL